MDYVVNYGICAKIDSTTFTSIEKYLSKEIKYKEKILDGINDLKICLN